MHVCQIIESTSGGSVRVALDLTQRLLASGDQVTFVYSPKRADARFLEEIKTIPDVKFVPHIMHRSVRLHDIRSGIGLWRLLRKEGPFDVLHAHSSKAGGLLRLASLFLPKSVIVYTPHAFITMSPHAHRLYGVIEKILSYFCDAIITVSQTEKDHAVSEIGIKSDLMHVVPNGVAFEKKVTREEACSSVGLSPDDFIVGYVGRLVAQKNPMRLVDAFTLVHKKKPDAKMIIVGNGELLDSVQKAVVKAGLEKAVVYCTNHQAREIMPAFDVLCCSSDYEGIPLVFLESLVVGVPVVTTPVGGTQEAVVPGETGFVSDAFTATSLADAVMCVAHQTPKEKGTMRAKALLHGGQFTVKQMGTRVRQIYETLLKSSGRIAALFFFVLPLI